MAPPGDAKHAAVMSKPPKLRRLPTNARIQKRPLLHPPIPTPYTSASSPKVIYIAPSTPFISAVKRVRGLLSQIEKRATQSASLSGSKPQDTRKPQAFAESGITDSKAREEEVVLKGTNRAIDKVLQLGLFFQGQGDVKVRIATGSVRVVDDIEVDEDDENSEEVEETRVRSVSMVEVGVRLR